MEKIITADGSETFFNEEVNESYHSKTGAIEESFEKFVKPLGTLLEKAFTEKIKILDICFGLGYNSAAALDYFDNCKIIGIEKDKNILNKVFEVNPKFDNYAEIKLGVKATLSKSVDRKNNKVRVIVGDALVEIKKLDEDFDIVLFDPFSPKKNPEMPKKLDIDIA